MNCDEARPLLHPYVDRELDLLRHVEMEEHLQGCPACAEQEQSLRSLRVALSEPSLYYRAPTALMIGESTSVALSPFAPRKNVTFAERRKSRLPLIASAAGVSCLAAAAIALFLLLRIGQSADDRLAESIAACHIRSLQVDHLKDVASSDQHTVKPWFRGKLDFSPQVPDFSTQGYTLIGGRLDYLADRTAAAIVYQCRLHILNVFQWPVAGDDRNVRAFSRHGYHIRVWQRAGMAYWAISDINDRDLDEFVTLFQEQATEAPH